MKDNITLSDCPSQTSGLTITEPLGTVEWKGDWSTLWNQATVEKNWKRWPRNSRGAFIKKFTYLSRLAMTTNSILLYNGRILHQNFPAMEEMHCIHARAPLVGLVVVAAWAKKSFFAATPKKYSAGVVWLFIAEDFRTWVHMRTCLRMETWMEIKIYID